MTHQQLRDLLQERVRDVTMPDLSVRAWQHGQQHRRRRRVAAVGVVVTATAAVSGLVALVDSSPRPDRPGPVTPGPGTPTTSPSAASSSASPSTNTAPDGFLGSLPVYFAPTLADEPDLPLMDSGRPPIPEVIEPNLARTPLASAGIDRAVVAMRVGAGPERSVVVVSPEGEYAWADTSGLSRVGDVAGNLHDPETTEMLAPDGAHLAFPQGDHLMVLDVATATWRRHDLRRSADPFEFVLWLDDRSVLAFGDGAAMRVDVTSGTVTPEEKRFWAPPAGLGRRASYYSFPVRSADGASAQSWFAGRPVTGPEAPTGAPEVLVVDAGRTVVAGFVDSAPAGPGGERYLGCCPAATWLGPGVVGYLSHGKRTHLVAWYAGSDRFERVTEIVGAFESVSFADLSR